LNKNYKHENQIQSTKHIIHIAHQ